MAILSRVSVSRGESGSDRCLGRTDEQHGHRGAAENLLGIAAEEQPADAAPAVRSEDDQIDAEFLRLIDDDVADPARERLRDVGRDLDAAGGDARLHLLQDLLAGVSQNAEDVDGVGFQACGEGELVAEVEDSREGRYTGRLAVPTPASLARAQGEP